MRMGLPLPTWLPFLIRVFSIVGPFGAVAYMFSNIHDMKSAFKAALTVLVAFMVFIMLWYTASAVEAMIWS